jgi:hypothetical protein
LSGDTLAAHEVMMPNAIAEHFLKDNPNEVLPSKINFKRGDALLRLRYMDSTLEDKKYKNKMYSRVHKASPIYRL